MIIPMNAHVSFKVMMVLYLGKTQNTRAQLLFPVIKGLNNYQYYFGGFPYLGYSIIYPKTLF